MVDSVHLSGAGSCIVADSSSISVVGSGVMSVQWLAGLWVQSGAGVLHGADDEIHLLFSRTHSTKTATSSWGPCTGRPSGQGSWWGTPGLKMSLCGPQDFVPLAPGRAVGQLASHYEKKNAAKILLFWSGILSHVDWHAKMNKESLISKENTQEYQNHNYVLTNNTGWRNAEKSGLKYMKESKIGFGHWLTNKWTN